MYVGMDKRLFRLGESICGLFRGAHIDSQALKHSSTLDIVYSTLRFKWSIYCPFRVLLSANSLVQLVLRLPQFIPLSKRPLSGCRTSEFRFKAIFHNTPWGCLLAAVGPLGCMSRRQVVTEESKNDLQLYTREDRLSVIYICYGSNFHLFELYTPLN